MERAERLLSGALFLGGWDPHPAALTASYFALRGRLTYCKLTKITDRSPNCIREDVLYLIEQLKKWHEGDGEASRDSLRVRLAGLRRDGRGEGLPRASDGEKRFTEYEVTEATAYIAVLKLVGSCL